LGKDHEWKSLPKNRQERRSLGHKSYDIDQFDLGFGAMAGTDASNAFMVNTSNYADQGAITTATSYLASDIGK